MPPSLEALAYFPSPAPHADSTVRAKRTRFRAVAGGGARDESQESDAALVDQARLGDQAAFETLMRRHERRAHGIAMALVKDENDAKEVVQEAFLRVHRGLPQFQGTASFFTWLYRIVTNLSIDLMRRPQRHETESIDEVSWEALSEPLAFSLVEGNPLEVLWRKELVQRIAACISSLPPYHRGVIMLRELDGLSYEEIAQEMGISKGTVMSRLFHARQKLQRSLQVAHSEMVGGSPPQRPRVMLASLPPTEH